MLQTMNTAFLSSLLRKVSQKKATKYKAGDFESANSYILASRAKKTPKPSDRDRLEKVMFCWTCSLNNNSLFQGPQTYSDFRNYSPASWAPGTKNEEEK